MPSGQRNATFPQAEGFWVTRGAMLMGTSTTIRGLERGLKVLQALQYNPISSLHDIYLETGISKPSLLRILNTLEKSGLISRRLADGRYRISANLSHLARKRDRYDVSPKRRLLSLIGSAKRFRGRPI